MTRQSLPRSSPSQPLPSPSSPATASTSGSSLLTATDYCLAVVAGLAVLVVFNVHYLLTQPYWLDEAWVADSVRAPLSQVPRMASSTPLGWTLLLRLVPFGGLERQRLVPLAFAGLAVATGYLLGRELRLTRFTAGLLTAAAVLLSPAMLARGDLKQYTAEAFAALLIWLLVARLENQWSRWRLAALGLVTSAGCLVASTAIITGAAALGCLGLECLLRRQWRRVAELAVTVAGTLAIFAVVYVVVLKPRINGTLSYYWRPRYLPGNQKSALSFLRVQFHDLAPYMGFPGHDGPLLTIALAACGVIALALLRRPALAILLPVTVVVVIIASAAQVYPFGDERTSTFWLVMVPVLMAIVIGGGIHLLLRALRSPGAATSGASRAGTWRTWARGAVAVGLTAVAVAAGAAGTSQWVQGKTLNPQNPYAQVRYVETHLRSGDVILVNSEASYAFAYYYKVPTDSYPEFSSAADGFVPQYTGDPSIIVLTDRDLWHITTAIARADAIIAAEPAGHRGRVWIIRDHVAWEEALFWKQTLTSGKVTTVSFRRWNGNSQEPLLVYQPPAPTSWSASGAQRGKVLSLDEGIAS